MEFDDAPVEISPADRRTDRRLLVNAPVEVSNIDRGPQITEKMSIEDIGDSGCRFSMRGQVQAGDRIVIQLLGQNGVRLEDAPTKFFEVMWVERGTETSAVGARILLGEKLTRCKLALESGAAKNSPG